ncbi:MAG: DUF1360 domain-containing protein [Chloroflexales bacterium]|nr:DUF1360 domain-containing protein [Chloroflexales bacterium]
MSLVTVVLGVLAVWRLTHLLGAEDGPWHVLARVRRAAGSGFWGQLLDCFYCLSLWVALPVALLLATGWREGIALWLGLSGGAILIERATTPPATFIEDPKE